MSKIVKKRKTNSIEMNYNLRSKSKRNKINDKINANNDKDINVSQDCEQITIKDMKVSPNMSQKSTKMPTKSYNLRQRRVGSNDDSKEPKCQARRFSLSELPDDCLLLILEKLDTIRDKCYIQSVCKRFYLLTNRLLKAQKVFSVNTTFGSSQQILTKEMCNNVITKCPNLQMFKMPGFYAKDNSSRTRARIGNEEMESLGRHCKDLRELDICGCGNVTESGVSTIIKSCSQLEKLSISFCTQVSGNSFSKLTKNFKQLFLNGNELTPSFEQSLKSLKSGDGKGLTDLNICLYNPIDSQDKILNLICENFKQLECLRYSIVSIYPCKFGSFGKLTNLTHLAFDSNSLNLNDEEFIKIIEGCHQLRSFFIRYEIIKQTNTISDCSLRKLPLYCPKLEKFHLHPKSDLIHTITDISIKNFVQLKHLESLSLKSFSSIGDSVIDVIKSCPKLNSLFLLNCHKVSNKTIEALIASAKAQPLKKLRFSISGDNYKVKRKKLPINLIDCSTN